MSRRMTRAGWPGTRASVYRLRQLEDELHCGVIRSHASGFSQARTGILEMERIAAQGNVHADLTVEQEGGDLIIGRHA